MINHTVIDSTVSKGYCSGCGICQSVCPTGALRIKYSNEKKYVPEIDEKLCKNCSACEKYCPNSCYEKGNQLGLLSKAQDPISFGIDHACGYYRCKSRNKDAVMRSASGGFVTEFAAELLRQGVIDCVLHGERIYSHTGEEHFQSCISWNSSDLDNRRSSIYGPLSFASALSELHGKSLKILAIGVPCAINGLKKLFQTEPVYSKNQLYTIALVCSHNVTGQFTDFLADYYGISVQDRYFVNLRGKNHNMKDHNEFRLHYKKSDGIKIIDEDRKVFNVLWRNYYFAMHACNYCMDLWGANADISVKDCWDTEGRNDQYGSNLVIFRNREFLSLFEKMQSLEIETIPFERVRVCEYPAAVYKQKDILKRIDIKTGILSDRKPTEFALRSIETCKAFAEGNKADILAQVEDGIKDNEPTFTAKVKTAIVLLAQKMHLSKLYFTVKPTINVIKNIFHYKKANYNKIIMLGGFDGENAGDEAQIDSTVKIMLQRYPGYIIKVLSHVPYNTWKNHYHCVVGPNPRMYIWDMDEVPYLYCSSLRNKVDRFRFLAKGYWACLNAYFVRANLPTLFLNAKRATILQDIKTSDLLYISGGGTMTGDTLSRCWDNVFCMKIAKILHVPFVMSGQNSGNWDSKFTEHFVRNILNQANAVTLRDAYAIENLKKIGVNRDCIFTMFDDALFCEKKDVTNLLDRYSIKGNYIVLNIHYWGCEDDLKAQNDLLQKIIKICDYIHLCTDSKILLLPFSSTDAQPIEDFVGLYAKDYIQAIRFSYYSFREIRGLISGAQYCITMKHHPIIFALGEKIPTISIAYKPYYVYKNTGALKIFGLEKYSIDLDDEQYLEKFKPLFNDLFNHREQISNYIGQKLEEIKPRREKLFQIIDALLNT